MNISEILPEKKIVIKKFAFSCDDIDEIIIQAYELGIEHERKDKHD